jgi:hypothetical protein
MFMMNLPHVLRRITMCNVCVKITDVSIRRNVKRCLTSLGKTFSEHDGGVCISDRTDLHTDTDSSVPVLVLTDKDDLISMRSVSLPMRVSLLRKAIQNFLTDNSI